MRILLAEDDPQLLDAVSAGLEFQWPDGTVLRATDGESGLQAFYDHDPDVVLLDVGLPELSGFEVLRQIRRVSDVPVLLLTGRVGEMDQVRGFELGADDYVVKPFGHLALLARIKAVLRRARLSGPVERAADFLAGDLAVHFESRRVTRQGRAVPLAPVEYQVLYQLVRNAGRVLPHRALLDRVWGPDSEATTEHLKVIIFRLRRKLGPDGTAQRIETVRGLGHRFVRRPAVAWGIAAGRVAPGSPAVHAPYRGHSPPWPSVGRGARPARGDSGRCAEWKGTVTAMARVVGYYANWAQYRPDGQGKFMPEQIDPSRLTHLNFAFGIFGFITRSVDRANPRLTGDFTVQPVEWNDQTVLYPAIQQLKSRNAALKTLLVAVP